MRLEDMILVSVDDHVVERPTMFERPVPARFRDHAPRVREKDGSHLWIFERPVTTRDLTLQLASAFTEAPE